MLKEGFLCVCGDFYLQRSVEIQGAELTQMLRNVGVAGHVGEACGIRYDAPMSGTLSQNDGTSNPEHGSSASPNLCRPDGRKSCAACCGLYNVPDGTRSTLMARLEGRTHAFGTVVRDPDAIAEFAAQVSERERVTPLDPVIHVCEFVGFVDSHWRSPGCLLHPSAPGNRGIDLRGLCHYGSMACKGFFCPATEQLEAYQTAILVELIDDWQLYGLVVTDVDYVKSVFRLVEGYLRGQYYLSDGKGDDFRVEGSSLDRFTHLPGREGHSPAPGGGVTKGGARENEYSPGGDLSGSNSPRMGIVGDAQNRLLLDSPIREVLLEMFSWKNSWPAGKHSTVRRSRYHFIGTSEPEPSDQHADVARLTECLAYSFQIGTTYEEAESMVEAVLRRLGMAPRI